MEKGIDLPARGCYYKVLEREMTERGHRYVLRRLPTTELVKLELSRAENARIMPTDVDTEDIIEFVDREFDVRAEYRKKACLSLTPRHYEAVYDIERVASGMAEGESKRALDRVADYLKGLFGMYMYGEKSLRP